MRLPRVRFTVRRLMAAVGAAAVALTFGPSLPDALQRSVWFGDPPFSMGGVPPAYLIVNPRLGFLFLPVLSFVVALDRPRRGVVWAAVAAGVLAVASWVLLRRVVGVGPGSLLIWPDSFVRSLPGVPPGLTMAPAPFYLWFVPPTAGAWADLLSLFGLLGLLALLLRPRPVPRRLRVVAALAALSRPAAEWVILMGTRRHPWFTNPRFLGGGLGGHFTTPPTPTDLAQGILFAALLTYYLMALLRPRSTRAEPGVVGRAPDEPANPLAANS